ncbi:hypothetical protein PR202_ga13809 [Eleusine coracana subsp. coracana]|uniref:AAA+ ATPase At3g28540-like C-terminal domain-containing protein n=1 Tax=Eleusine coracana subsp. coracana TaxID=191504 RepID=A0AAV5CFY0_ELECO|nr:hypothetical protein QOZ80_3AG0212330 [Eleusine coracana subsp. coracana]GJM96931.1 hypothetical protein PR202_ga13809 [Eleusine coracana subsp. coracana]
MVVGVRHLRAEPAKDPAAVATLAMDPAEKKKVLDDLDTFKSGKDYYARLGKAWKRGYLLYGLPGTGKSAMANHLDYDLYDIQLTSVHSNTDLYRLFIETTSKGRMDRHIEMSYCCFQAFKFVAKMYLDVDAHHLFDAVQKLLKDVEMTPADVAENLTPKSADDDAHSCLAALVMALEEAKEKKATGGGGGGGQDGKEE